MNAQITRVRRSSRPAAETNGQQLFTVEFAERTRKPSLIADAFKGYGNTRDGLTRGYHGFTEANLKRIGIHADSVPLRTKAGDKTDGWLTIDRPAQSPQPGYEIHLRIVESTTPDAFQATQGDRAIKQVPASKNNPLPQFFTYKAKTYSPEQLAEMSPEQLAAAKKDQAQDGMPIYRKVNVEYVEVGGKAEHAIINSWTLAPSLKPAAAPAEQQTTAAAAEAASTSPVYA